MPTLLIFIITIDWVIKTETKEKQTESRAQCWHNSWWHALYAWPCAHRRTGQHPFGGGGRPSFAWMDSGGGGGSSRHFPGSIHRKRLEVHVVGETTKMCLFNTNVKFVSLFQVEIWKIKICLQHVLHSFHVFVYYEWLVGCLDVGPIVSAIGPAHRDRDGSITLTLSPLYL